MNSLDKILASMRSGKYGSVIDPKGNVKRFRPNTKPDAPEVIEAIEAALKN